MQIWVISGGSPYWTAALCYVQLEAPSMSHSLAESGMPLREPLRADGVV